MRTAGGRGILPLAPGGLKAIRHQRSRRTIRIIYPAADFLIPIVKALVGVRRRVMRERGIDAIKIAPMSAHHRRGKCDYPMPASEPAARSFSACQERGLRRSPRPGDGRE